MNRRDMMLAGAGAAALAYATGARGASIATGQTGGVSVRQFGAKGDGATIDSDAINKAIDHVSERGGGTVYVPAGRYSCYSIRMKSGVTLYLDHGSIIEAAPWRGPGQPGFDLVQDKGEDYKDQYYGEHYPENSMIWGRDLHDIAILGPGLVYGKGLSRGFYRPWGPNQESAREGDMFDKLPLMNERGAGNKAIALMECRNVTLRDFKVLQGGWFAVIVTGIENLTVDNVTVDTIRDGIDIVSCRNVRVTNCTVNTPWDDGICLKSNMALGKPVPCENVTISDCYLSAFYELGSVIDGSYQRMPAPFKLTATGRIKFGTESNGDFRNVTITNCVFEDSRGILLTTVDGGNLEDITISNITMRGSMNSPIFLRLGRRLHAALPGTPVGKMRRILINNITSSHAAPVPSMIVGVPGHPVEDVKISNVYLHARGGGTAAQAAAVPGEHEKGYPEPSVFGDIPAHGFFIRHARNVEMNNVELALAATDARPAFWMKNVDGARFSNLRLPSGQNFRFDDVSNFRLWDSTPLADTSFTAATTKTL